jgi:hypothetical protein
VRGESSRVLCARKSPQHVRRGIAHVRPDRMRTLPDIEVQCLVYGSTTISLIGADDAVTGTLDSHITRSGSFPRATRPLRAISAHARHAPCHVPSAMAGMSYMEAAAREWIENSPVIVSNT